ncbi:MAG: hypothetical protein Q9M29_01570 [Mariprofundaceae bacterium]|nr:hypothetical protein [Mariprofundaceae bacterium]
MLRHIPPSSPPPSQTTYALCRRGLQLGSIVLSGRPGRPSDAEVVAAWRADQPVMLPSMLDVAAAEADIRQAHLLMKHVLDSGSMVAMLDAPPCTRRLAGKFTLVAVSGEEHDAQGIEKLYFDACQDDTVVAEDLWCKASWLSFHDEDASLRFRFSFGMEGFEDVAADPERQRRAGRLTEAIFPESRAITENETLLPLLRAVLGSDPAFVERIVYFNAPNGGAQMHHDVERGHAGVIYGQLSGSTFWLAAAKPVLMDELIIFARHHPDAIAEVLPDAAARKELTLLLADRPALSGYMDEPDHELVEAVMDRSPAFVHHMVSRRYGYVLHPGDVLLLPQRDLEACVWHTVFCLDDAPGEGLSFAIRGSD